MSSSQEPRYLTLGDVIALHDEVMESLGSAPALLLDEGKLESAVARPQMAAYYEGADLVRQCALLAVGIVQAHAFLDGNERTAYWAIRAFLGSNALRFIGEPLELAQQLEGVASQALAGEQGIDRFEAWLRERVAPRGS